MENYRRLNHEKFILKYHIILSTKYRKKLLGSISDDIKKYMKLAEASQNKWSIEIIEIDKNKPDHIHFLINATPTDTIANIIHKLKQFSTYYVWKEHSQYMNNYYWSGKHYLWTRGYFCSSIGSVSKETVYNYIEKQG